MKTNWKSEFVPLANGQKLHVRQTGGELPVLLLIHGITDSGRYWSRLAADLEHEFNVMMPDMLGHGRSDRLTGSIGVDGMADHVLEIMNHYSIERGQIAGHSMGGGIALMAASAHPDRFSGVVFEDPAFSNPQESGPFYLNMTAETLAWKTGIIEQQQLSNEAALKQLTEEKVGWHPADVAYHLDDKMEIDLAVFDQIDFSPSKSWPEDLARINAPILLVIGEVELGSLVSEEAAQQAVALMQNGEYTLVKGTGHGIHRENYSAFRDVVRPFFVGNKIK